MFDVLNATEFLIPSVEILDSRLHRTDPETGSRSPMDTGLRR
jgi:2-oxo-hept-3-ene-1,7-dioate hydratase